MNNDFRDKEAVSLRTSREWLDGFYQQMAGEGGRFCRVPGQSKTLDSDLAYYIQLHLHGDVIVFPAEGEPILIDEKIQTRSWPTFALETAQSTITHKPGWMWSSKADSVLYAFPDPSGGLVIYLLPTRALRRWFAAHIDEYPVQIGTWCSNRPEFSVVPIEDVRAAIKVKCYTRAPQEDAVP